MVFTSCDDEATVVAALEAGADDYLVKSAGRAQLSARVTALARRIRQQPVTSTRIDDYEYDLQEQSISVHGQAISMTQRNSTSRSTRFKTPESCSRETICSTRSGASTATWIRERLTPMSAAFAKTCP